MKHVAAIKKEIAKAQKLLSKVEDGRITFTMKDGSIITVAHSEVAGDNATLYGGWVTANADPEVRDSEGSFGHQLDQAVAGCDNAPFEPWPVFKARWDRGECFAPVLDDEEEDEDLTFHRLPL